MIVPVPVPVLQALAPASTEQGILLWLRVHQWAPGQSPAPVSQGLLSHLYGHSVKIDLRLRIEVRQPVLLQYMLNVFEKKSQTVVDAPCFGCGRGSRVCDARTPAPSCRRCRNLKTHAKTPAAENIKYLLWP
jgi:hypothetical protein